MSTADEIRAELALVRRTVESMAMEYPDTAGTCADISAIVQSIEGRLHNVLTPGQEFRDILTEVAKHG